MVKWLVDQYCAIPSEWRAAAGSWLKSLAMASVPILGVMYGVASSQGKANDLPTFVTFLHASWFGLLMGYFFGGANATYRGKQAFTAVKTNTVVTP